METIPHDSNGINFNNTRDAHRVYNKVGFGTVPIAPQAKRPSGPQAKEWETKVFFPENFNPRGNIGVKGGRVSSNLVNLDNDTPETRRAATILAPKTLRSGHDGELGHYWFFAPDVPESFYHKFRDHDGTTLLEVRGDHKHQTLLPPSKHAVTGNPYEWDGEFDTDRIVTRSAAELLHLARKIATVGIIARNLPAGSRHDWALGLAGLGLENGMDDDEWDELLHAGWAVAGASHKGDLNRVVSDTRKCIDRDKGYTHGKHVDKISNAPVSDKIRDIWDWPQRKNRQKSRFDDSNDSNDSKFQDLAELIDPLAFPVDALPEKASKLAVEAAKAIGCPVDYVGVSILASLSAAIGNSRRIKLKEGWEEPAVLYTAIIGEPSSKKTPAMKEGTRPITRLQVEYRDEYEDHKKLHAEKMRSHLVEKRKAAKEERPEPTPDEKPVMQRCLVEDTTVERLGGILNENWRGVLLYKDELSGWARSMDQYKNGQGSDRQFWLSTWSTAGTVIDRKSNEEPLFVPQPFVTILGGIQPDILPELGKDRADGLLDRFLFSYPERMKTRWTDDEIRQSTRDGMYSTLEGILNLKIVTDTKDREESKSVPLSKEAKEVFKEVTNALHEETEQPGFPARLLGPWAKLEAYLARIALVLAMSRVVSKTGATERVEKSDMQAAVRFLEYFQNHARRVYTGLYGTNPTDRLAEDLKNFVVSAGGTWEGTATDLYNALDSEFKPDRPEDLSKAVRAIAKKSPAMTLDEDRTKATRTLKIAVIAVTAVTEFQAYSEDLPKASSNGQRKMTDEEARKLIKKFFQRDPERLKRPANNVWETLKLGGSYSDASDLISEVRAEVKAGQS